MKVRFKKLCPDAVIPTRGTQGAAAFDLYTCEDAFIGDTREIIHTGIAIELPRGFVADVRPRSGISVKGLACYAEHKGARISCIAFPKVVLGTIDEDYRGEVGIIIESTQTGYIIPKGTRLAQLLIHQIPEIEFEEAEELSATDRGADGYGSTGR